MPVGLSDADHAEGSEPIARFDVGGVSYGPEETAILRRTLIEMRDAALKDGMFQIAVNLSHVIGLLAMMMKHIWPHAEDKT